MIMLNVIMLSYSLSDFLYTVLCTLSQDSPCSGEPSTYMKVGIMEINVIGGIKLEPLQIKEDPGSVEIRIEDILHSSDEEKVENEQPIENMPTDAHSRATDKQILNAYDKNQKSSKGPVEELILNYGQNGEGPVCKKVKHIKPGEIDWSEVYNSTKITDCTNELDEVKTIEASEESSVVAPHEYTTLSKTKYICNYCHKAMSKRYRIFKHIIRIHRADVLMYQCPFCPFKSKYKLKSHILHKHKDSKDIQWFHCYVCSLKFKQKAGLRVHMSTHFPNQIHSCHICGIIFHRRENLRRHVARIHMDEPRKNKCEKCSYVSNYKHNLKNHMERRHTDREDLPTYKCANCNFKTKVKQTFLKHKKKHVTEIHCDKCSFKTNVLEVFKLHMLSYHKKPEEKDLKYRCNQCDYKTFRVYNLNVHQLNHLKPEEIQYFYCYNCDFKAKRKDNLKTHVLRHFKKEEVEMCCYLCDFSTKKRSKLTGHIENNHTKA